MAPIEQNINERVGRGTGPHDKSIRSPAPRLRGERAPIMGPNDERPLLFHSRPDIGQWWAWSLINRRRLAHQKIGLIITPDLLSIYQCARHCPEWDGSGEDATINLTLY